MMVYDISDRRFVISNPLCSWMQPEDHLAWQNPLSISELLGGAAL